MDERGAAYLEATRRRVVIFDGAMGTSLQLADLSADDYGGPALEGCSEAVVLSPSRRRQGHPPLVPRRRRPTWSRPNAFGGFGVVLAEYGLEDRVAGDQPDRGPPGPGGRRRGHRRGRRRAAPLGGGQPGPRHQVPHPGPDPLPRAAQRLSGAGECADRGRRRPHPRRDRLRPPPGQGRHQRGRARHGRCGPARAHPGPGDHRADRPDAPGHRDRRRAHRPRPHAARHHRAQLRHRAGRDGRGHPLPVPALPTTGLRAAQRRPALGRRRQDALRPDSGPAGGSSRALHHRARGQRRGRLLRHDPGAPARRGGAVPRSRAAAPPATAIEHEPGASSIYSNVGFHQDTSFLVVGERTNANGSKKFRDAMLEARLGHHRRHRARPGERGRARPRRVRGLHRGRRRIRHDRGRQPARHPGERPAHGRLHRGTGGGSGPDVDRGPAHPQLRQPRGG